MIQHLIDAYVELLKVQNISIRVNLQSTYCFLRDTIANETNQSNQGVQEKYEEIALIESNPIEFGMLQCQSFIKFIGADNKNLIEGWPPLAKNYWDTYKYAYTKPK